MSIKQKIHPDVTLDRVMAASEDDDNVGFCIACGDEQGHVEIDAKEYECACCGKKAVYGTLELLLALAI